MQVKGFIGRELPTYMHGRKRSGDDNYTCNGEENGAKLNQKEEKDGQIKSKRGV
jgi:hypothetical protein